MKHNTKSVLKLFLFFVASFFHVSNQLLCLTEHDNESCAHENGLTNQREDDSGGRSWVTEITGTDRPVSPRYTVNKVTVLYTATGHHTVLVGFRAAQTVTLLLYGAQERALTTACGVRGRVTSVAFKLTSLCQTDKSATHCNNYEHNVERRHVT